MMEIRSFVPRRFSTDFIFSFTSSSSPRVQKKKNNFTTREMKLFSNLLKLSLAPFAVVLGLSEVPLGIRNGFKNPNSFHPFRRLKSSV